MALPDSKVLPDSSKVKLAVPDSHLEISECPKVLQNPLVTYKYIISIMSLVDTYRRATKSMI